MADTAFEGFRDWVGRRREEHDTITEWPVRAMHATLDREAGSPAPGDELPPAWHWLYFLEARPASQIARDGHPERGDFLPPVPLPGPRSMTLARRVESGPRAPALPNRSRLVPARPSRPPSVPRRRPDGPGS